MADTRDFQENKRAEKAKKGVDIVEKYYRGTHFFIPKTWINISMLTFVLGGLTWFFGYAQQRTYENFSSKEERDAVISLVDIKNPVVKKSEFDREISLVRKDMIASDTAIVRMSKAEFRNVSDKLDAINNTQNKMLDLLLKK